MDGLKVVIVDNRFDSYKEEEMVLSELNCNIEVCKSSDEDVIVKYVRDADAVIVNLAPIGRKLIESMEKCKVISRYGVGYDNVDVDSATKAGIWVANVPDYSIEDVSDHALALLLSCIRKIAFKDREIRKGEWNLHKKQPVHRIRNRVLGLIGYGKIAMALHRKVLGFGLKEILVYDPYVSKEKIMKKSGRKVDLNILLTNSDYISIHVPLSKETEKLIGEKEFSLMKKNTIVINTSRGPIIDEKALIEALRSNKIECAGIDVFEKEPLSKDHPFKMIDNIVITDHAAYYSEESIVELKEKAAKNVIEVLKGNSPIYSVNNVLQNKKYK